MRVHALPSSHQESVNSVQIPSAKLPACFEHASHTPPLHALSQQTPSTQKPLKHSWSTSHAEPSLAFVVQTLALQ